MDYNQLVDYIRQAALLRNMDPNVVYRVGQSEGLQPGTWQSNVVTNGVREPSYGQFQMLLGGGNTGFPEGVGNDFVRATGLDVRNPANAKQMIDFALNTAVQRGWTPWAGASKAGVGARQGLAGAHAVPVSGGGAPMSATSAMLAPGATAGPNALGDLVAPKQVQSVSVPPSDAGALTFDLIRNANERKRQEAEEQRAVQERRAALFTPPAAPLAAPPQPNVWSLYG